jgi:hypothetical protein
MNTIQLDSLCVSGVSGYSQNTFYYYPTSSLSLAPNFLGLSAYTTYIRILLPYIQMDTYPFQKDSPTYLCSLR